ncbi:hypothetical protein OROMI_016308 [Orobanche minor]
MEVGMIKRIKYGAWEDPCLSKSKSPISSTEGSTSSIKFRDSFSLITLLSGKAGGMDDLNRINGERLKVDEKTFIGKYVLVWGLDVPVDSVSVDPFGLLPTCSHLYSTRDDFEMIVVAKMNTLPNDAEVFSCFLADLFPSSCLVVPVEDLKRRRFLCNYFDNFRVHCELVVPRRSIFPLGQGCKEVLQTLFRERVMKSIWPVIPEEQKNPSTCEGTCPVARILKPVMPEYPDHIIKMVSKLSPVEIGQYFNVISLLSSQGQMNYLHRNNGGRVQVEEAVLSGKYVMICCFYVPISREFFASKYLQSLVTTCSDLYKKKNDFEMVVVAKMNNVANDEVIFNHFLSGFPSSCLVVPFKDSFRRDFICKYLDLPGRFGINCLLLDITGNVLLHGHPDFVSNYGADAFPFTLEALCEVQIKDIPYWETPSTSTLEGLLGCNSSDVLDKINPAGVREAVTIAELSKKLVGLYLCIEEKICPTLIKVHEQCKLQKLPFEIVLAYLPFLDCLDPEVYKVKIDRWLQNQNISWWRLPYNNSVSRRLRRFGNYAIHNKLIIMGPCGKYVDPYGGEVLSSCGFDAYPFTREELVKKEVDKLMEVTLESLLVYGSRNYVLRGNDRIALTELQGRNILLYFAGPHDPELGIALFTWYYDIKAKDPDFEVVFVRQNLSRTPTEIDEIDEYLVPAMPWLVCPFVPDHSAFVEEKIFFRGGAGDTLVQFGKNGRISTLRVANLLNKDGPGNFPFVGNLRKDVITQLRITEDFMDDMN